MLLLIVNVEQIIFIAEKLKSERNSNNQSAIFVGVLCSNLCASSLMPFNIQYLSPLKRTAKERTSNMKTNDIDFAERNNPLAIFSIICIPVTNIIIILFDIYEYHVQ